MKKAVAGELAERKEGSSTREHPSPGLSEQGHIREKEKGKRNIRWRSHFRQKKGEKSRRGKELIPQPTARS